MAATTIVKLGDWLKGFSARRVLVDSCILFHGVLVCPSDQINHSFLCRDSFMERGNIELNAQRNYLPFYRRIRL